MDEVGTAVIAISLVLIAVFVPTAFIPGISGQFYQQFALTIAVSTVDLGLQFADACRRRWRRCCSSRTTHTRAAQFLSRARRAGSPTASIAASTGCRTAMPRIVGVLVGHGRARHHAAVYRRPASPARSTWCRAVPRGFIPTLDQGYAIVVVQLPDGASLSRTDAVVQRASRDHRRRRRACTTPWPSPASPARPSPTPPTPASIFAPLQAVRRAARRTASRPTQIIGRSVRQPAGDPGGLHHRHPAAAGARHRQCRRLQDADAGAQRRRHAARCWRRPTR